MSVRRSTVFENPRAYAKERDHFDDEVPTRSWGMRSATYKRFRVQEVHVPRPCLCFFPGRVLGAFYTPSLSAHNKHPALVRSAAHAGQRIW